MAKTYSNKDANFDSSAAMNLPSDTLTGLGNGNLLDELEGLGPLAKSGKIHNYEAWLKDLATKRGKGVAAAVPWAQEAQASAATAAAPVDMNKPWGIDFDAWKARLKAQGIKGDIDAIIERAKGGGHDAIAARGELRGAERAHARGNEVEMITPPASKGAAQGELSPEAKLTQGGEEKAFEQETATAPPDRKTWNAHADEANKQIKAAKKPGEISFDWTEVDLSKSDFPSAGEIEGFLNGKMTKERLKEVRYFEIVWKDSKGQTWVTSRTRAADGALGAVTTVRQ